jgi:putative membrane protein
MSDPRDESKDDPKDGVLFGSPETEMSSNRTQMSIERTHMSLDRTLMSSTRTSLALIGFGFTIFQVFNSWIDKIPGAIVSGQPRHVALIMIGLGILMLILGLYGHWRGVSNLDERRARLHRLGLIHHRRRIPPSSTAIIAFVLLVVGIYVFANIAFRLHNHLP